MFDDGKFFMYLTIIFLGILAAFHTWDFLVWLFRKVREKL